MSCDCGGTLVEYESTNKREEYRNQTPKSEATRDTNSSRKIIPQISPLSNRDQLLQEGRIPHSRQKTNFRKVNEPVPKKDKWINGSFFGRDFAKNNL